MAAPTLALHDVAEQVVLDRRHLHAHPELGFQEQETAAFIAERLRSLGLEVQTGVAQTGVVGLLRGARPGKTALLCADIDALPIQEQNDVPYRSQVAGVMHACGHDGHTAILLNTASVLAERRDTLSGNVKFVFQPSEEAPPGGAIKMIEEGVLENPHVDAAFGLHLVQNLPLGTIMARPGPISAASDFFRIEIAGKGDHAAGGGHGWPDPGRHRVQRHIGDGAAGGYRAHLRPGGAAVARSARPGGGDRCRPRHARRVRLPVPVRLPVGHQRSSDDGAGRVGRARGD